MLLQTKGGGIGDKLAQASARLFMIWWDSQFLLVLKSASITITLYKRYVDDANCKCIAVPPGAVWDPVTRSIVQEVSPELDQRPPDMRTAEVIRKIADSVTPMLSWTADYPSAHSSKKLPVLDIQIWVTETDEGTLTNYEFYRKPMANPVSIPAESALSNNVKFSTYRQEVVRVLKNTAVHLPWSRKASLLSELCHRMQLAGYKEGFRAKVISEGIVGYVKKVSVAFNNKTPLNRPKNVIEANKRKKKDWLRSSTSSQCQSVLFVPATPGSVLARSIRQCEERNVQGRHVRIKVVERSGKSVKNTLAPNYPWKPQRCDDSNCFPCSSGTMTKISCRKPGVAYKIKCTICSDSGIDSVYEGESGKCLFERGKKHLSEFQAGLSTNAMVIHNRIHHNCAPSLNFEMVAVKTFTSPLERQLDEALRIKNSEADVLMNSGSEWRLDSIPRASFTAPGLERRRTRGNNKRTS